MPLCQCPACSGLGHTAEFVCCGRLGDGGCCGSPDLADMCCETCSGSGSIALDAFLDYAIRTRDLSLLAEYESIRIIEEIGPDNLPYRRKPARGI